jgi:uncharacterized membrane protein YedE/YeeE
MDFLNQPWPWYVTGPLIGLMVPLLLILGNKAFSISSTLRTICASCTPIRIPFFDYDWRKEIWNLVFVGGIAFGGMLGVTLLDDPQAVQVHPSLVEMLSSHAITDYSQLVPADLFNWDSLFTLRGFLLIVLGGFLVGFGTRYAGGCTSGHAIMGLSNLQLPSLIATVCFMIGGFATANLVLPHILAL